jgi:hypothetical protein
MVNTITEVITMTIVNIEQLYNNIQVTPLVDTTIGKAILVVALVVATICWAREEFNKSARQERKQAIEAFVESRERAVRK